MNSLKVGTGLLYGLVLLVAIVQSSILSSILPSTTDTAPSTTTPTPPVKTDSPQALPFDPLKVESSKAEISPEEAAKISKSIKTVDPEEFKKSFRKSKSNKVSMALHFLHGISNRKVYDPKQVENVQAIVEQPDFAKMSDEQLMKTVCKGGLTETLCEKAAKVAMDKEPEHVAEIADSIRKKPVYVNARKLLWHKLFETAIAKVEDNKYDEKLDKVINVAAAKNPYVFAATKIIDSAV